MKTRTTITEITKEDLVDLLCTATYGSSWIEIFRDKNITAELDTEEDDCREDIWAKLLFAGKSLYFADFNAWYEDEHYGKLLYEWDEKEQCMKYTFNLQDIIHGLEKAADCDSQLFSSFRNRDDGSFDIIDAESLMQYIIFGELIYG